MKDSFRKYPDLLFELPVWGLHQYNVCLLFLNEFMERKHE